jgi:type IV pilus assembly protein PilM
MGVFSSKQAPIGLDIGKSSIVGVQVTGKSPNTVLKAYYERPIPEGLVFEGEIVDPGALSEELKAFMREANMKGKFVNMGVGNQKVIVRHIEVPEMSEEELRGAIEFQARDYIPIPIEEAVLDSHVVARLVDEDGVAKQQVLLVAAQREMIERFIETAKRAGLKVAGIDVTALALVRALSTPVAFVDQGAEGGRTLGMLHVSSSVSTLVVATDNVLKFTRTFNFAFDNFVRASVERQGVQPADAVALCEHVGLPGPAQPDDQTYGADTIDEVRTALTPVAEELGEEIRRSLDYYQSQNFGAHVERVLLTGRGAAVRNLDAFLTEHLGVKVELGNPLLKLAENDSGIPNEVLAALAPRAAVAVGLALEEED